MNHYKVGYKAVIEIDKVFEQDGEKLYRAKGMKSLVFDGKGLDKLKSLSAYTETLKKEAEENYRMGVNAEYEKWKEHLSRIRDVWQNEAWELALKLRYMGYEDKLECFGLKHDGEEKWVEIMEKYTYQEAAAKVAQWEKAKEEIKVDGNCEICQFFHKENDEYPCSHCCHCYTSKFKQIGGEDA